MIIIKLRYTNCQFPWQFDLSFGKPPSYSVKSFSAQCACLCPLNHCFIALSILALLPTIPGQWLWGYVKLDSTDYNNCIPLLLIISFVLGATEDRQGAICQIWWHQLARNGVSVPVTSSHSTVGVWVNLIRRAANYLQWRPNFQ